MKNSKDLLSKMNEMFELGVIYGNSEYPFVLSLSVKNNLIVLEYCSKELKLKGSFADVNYSLVLNKLINLLEKEECQLCCFGARYDVHSSGMGKSMSLGKKSYILNRGKAVKREDLVNIFEYSNVNLGTLLEKKEYYKKWLKSFSSYSL